LAAFNKVNQFAYDLSKKVHNLNSDGINVGLTNTAPVAATTAVLADITDLSTSGGYTAGGASVTPSGGSASGTFTLTGTNVVWTASGGGIGPFQYIFLYNTSTSPNTKPVMGWWDYGSALTLNGSNGDTLTVKFNGGASTGTILTVA
jgi:hypothetical protein